METQINSMSEETAGRLAEVFNRLQIDTDNFIKASDQLLQGFMNSTHLDLKYLVADYALKHVKGNIFTKWYYKRQLKKYTKRLHIFETELLPKYNAMK